VEHRFSIPVSMVIESDGRTITIKIDRAETTIELPAGLIEKASRFQSDTGLRLSDIVLESALMLKKKYAVQEFTAADLLHEAEQRHPGLNKRSFWSRVISSAPNHPSAKHFKSTNRYLRYIGNGTYMLEPKSIITADPNWERSRIDESLWGDENG
jgi:hypothetical protein